VKRYAAMQLLPPRFLPSYVMSAFHLGVPVWGTLAASVPLPAPTCCALRQVRSVAAARAIEGLEFTGVVLQVRMRGG
jgi:hypothetical protein